MNKKIGIIVDGQGDYNSLNKRFQKGFKILKTDGPRGHNALMNQIVKRSKKQVGILSSFRCSRVIIMIDFENRSENYDDFVFGLKELFESTSFPLTISIAVPNKMIENWYLADINNLSKKKGFLKDGIRQSRFEGTDGKKEIKKLMIKKISYSETKHGPQMFELLDFDVARRNSSSFNEFLNLLA